MVLPMCPRPTKPILVAVAVGISRPPFDRRNAILAELEVRRAEDRVDLGSLRVARVSREIERRPEYEELVAFGYRDC
jgi:hypothetical protein